MNDEFLAFFEGILDARGSDINPFLEVAASDFFERQKAVSLFAVIDKACLKTGFDPGNNTFIYIAFALFASGGFDVKVNELLPVNDSNA